MSLTNFLVRYSLTRFNKHRKLRILCRQGYWFLGELYCFFSPLHHRNLAKMKRGDILDTYPRFYQNISRMASASWTESDDEDNYSLVPDPSRSVVGYATSYCAYKIKETTGSWPKRVSKGKRFDANNWVAFLREAGYYEVDHQPSKNFYYVGVRTHSCHTYGEVVWLERYEDKSVGSVLVTTYDQKTFVPKIVRAPDYVWVKIARRTAPSPQEQTTTRSLAVST